MKLVSEAIAGTLESSDAFIMIEQNTEEGIEIHLESLVERRYGRHIRQMATECLQGLGVHNARVKIHDKGALDCTIKARLQAAAFRAAGIDAPHWEEL